MILNANSSASIGFRKLILSPALVAGLGFLLGTAGTNAQGPANDPVVATVNGEKILLSQVDDLLSKQIPGGSIETLPKEQLTPIRRQMLEGLIADRLVTKASEKTEVTDADVAGEYQKVVQQAGSEDALKAQLTTFKETPESLRADIRDALRKQKWVEAQMAGKSAVTDADVTAFYEDNPNISESPESIHASHILLLTKEPGSADAKLKQITEIRQSILGGESFEIAAKKFSEDPGSKDLGGDLNYFTRGKMVKEFEDAAFSLEPGDISGPVKTEYGYHIIKVTDKKAARKISKEEFAPKIRTHLEGQKRQGEIIKIIEGLKAQAEIKTELN